MKKSNKQYGIDWSLTFENINLQGKYCKRNSQNMKKENKTSEDYSKTWDELTLDEKVKFAEKNKYGESETAKFWWNYYHYKYCGNY